MTGRHHSDRPGFLPNLTDSAGYRTLLRSARGCVLNSLHRRTAPARETRTGSPQATRHRLPGRTADHGRAHEATAQAEQRRPELEQRLASISAEIARAEQALESYDEAFEQGTLSAERCEQRLTRPQARLDDLRAQEAELSLQAPHKATQAPTAADLAALAEHLESVIADADPQKAKALLRLLIKELRVNGRAEILPTYRLVTPAVCAMSEKVGVPGIEPGTSRV